MGVCNKPTLQASRRVGSEYTQTGRSRRRFVTTALEWVLFLGYILMGYSYPLFLRLLEGKQLHTPEK